jgi:hypothetical protein
MAEIFTNIEAALYNADATSLRARLILWIARLAE